MADIDITLKIQLEKALKRLDKLEKSATKADKKFDKLRKSSEGLSKGFKILAAAAAGIGLFRVVKSLLGVAASAVQAAGNLELLEVQFAVLTESATKARDIMIDLKDFASKTPFRLEGVGLAAKSLLAFGVTTEDLQQKLKVIGDVASVTGKDFKELAVIFGQIKNRGQLTGDNLRQLNEAGVAIGPALVKSMGIAKEAIRPLMEQGKIAFSEFEKAFDSLNQKGGQAFNGMEIASKTLNGRLSTLADNIGFLKAAVGAKFAPAVKGIVIVFNEFAKRLVVSSTVMKTFGDLAKKIPIIVASIGVTIDSVNESFGNFRKIMTVLPALTNEFALSMLKLKLAGQETSIAMQSVFGRKFPGTVKAIAETKELIKTLETAGDLMGEDLKNIGKDHADMSEAIKNSSKEIVDAINAEVEASIRAATLKSEEDKKQTDSTKKLTLSELEAIDIKRKAMEELQAKLKVAQEQVAIDQEAQRLFDTEREILFQDERLIRLEESFTREQEATLQAHIALADGELAKELLITEIQSKGLQKRLKQDAKAAKDKEKLEKDSKINSLTNAAGLFGALGSLAAVGGKKLFQITKALNLAEAITSGLLAVQKALALGPVLGPPAATIAKITTVANVARIASTQPSFEQGGFVGGSSFSGDNVDVRVNSGEAILNSRQQKEFMSIANGSGSNNEDILNSLDNISAQLENKQPVIIEVDGREIAQTVKDETDKGFIL